MKERSRSLQQAIRLALAACATSGVSLAYAQTAPDPGVEAPALQEVVVTGSRIAVAPNDISMAPITTVNQVDIQETGLLRTEDVLNYLPSITAEQGSGNSISSVGTATVSLYNLGSQRTLVLVNGRRVQPGGSGGIPPGNSSAVDINQIPAALIERVDVLTGGASSVYGADAVAGVVNFVMNTHFQGVEIESNYSYYNHKNGSNAYLGYLSDAGVPAPQHTANTGQSKDFTIIAGSNFADGKGNATAYFGYLNTLPVAGYQIDHAGCTLNGGTTSADSRPRCGGSPTSPTGNFFALGQVGGATTTLFDNTVDKTTGVFRPFNDATDLYNYGALSYFQRQSERYTAGAYLNYDVNDHATVYTETMFARNHTQAQFGPSGDFTNLATFSCANPLLTPSEVNTICSPANLAANQLTYPNNAGTDRVSVYIGRRNVEGGGRQDNYTSESIRQVAGVKGSFSDVWSYDAYAQVGITQFQDVEANFLNTQLINNALDVVTDPATGAPACAVAVSGADPACVPWNIFQAGGVTPAALNYLTTPATYSALSTEYVTDANVTGNLGKYGLKLPTADTGLSVNIGAEYREEKFEFKPDYIFSNGFQAGGAPSKPISGGLHVWEGFTEAHMPILAKMPGAYNLSVDVGYRYSNYTLGGSTNTYKFSVEYAPIEDVRFRGGYNRAVRAPNLGELFQPAAVGAGGSADPCWGPTPQLSQAACANTGVTAAEYGHVTVNPAAQTNTIQGGNSGLSPEIADTYTIGVVFAPTFIPKLVVSLDAFNIKIKNTIEELSSTTIITTCANTATLCDLIHRGPTGSLWFNTTNFVVATEQNIGSFITRGANLESRYQMDLSSFGRIGFNWKTTFVKDFETQPIPGLGQFDCAGYGGNTCGNPEPHFRSVFQTTWGTPWQGIDLTARLRYLGPTQAEGVSQNPQLAASGFYQGVAARIPGYSYLDLSASAKVLDQVSVRVGVNNVADKNPPLVLGGTFGCNANDCNDNTWVGTYDTLGRYLYANVTLKF